MDEVIVVEGTPPPRARHNHLRAPCDNVTHTPGQLVPSSPPPAPPPPPHHSDVIDLIASPRVRTRRRSPSPHLTNPSLTGNHLSSPEPIIVDDAPRKRRRRNSPSPSPRSAHPTNEPNVIVVDDDDEEGGSNEEIDDTSEEHQRQMDCVPLRGRTVAANSRLTVSRRTHPPQQLARSGSSSSIVPHIPRSPRISQDGVEIVDAGEISPVAAASLPRITHRMGVSGGSLPSMLESQSMRPSRPTRAARRVPAASMPSLVNIVSGSTAHPPLSGRALAVRAERQISPVPENTPAQAMQSVSLVLPAPTAAARAAGQPNHGVNSHGVTGPSATGPEGAVRSFADIHALLTAPTASGSPGLEAFFESDTDPNASLDARISYPGQSFPSNGQPSSLPGPQLDVQRIRHIVDIHRRRGRRIQTQRSRPTSSGAPRRSALRAQAGSQMEPTMHHVRFADGTNLVGGDNAGGGVGEPTTPVYHAGFGNSEMLHSYPRLVRFASGTVNRNTTATTGTSVHPSNASRRRAGPAGSSTTTSTGVRSRRMATFASSMMNGFVQVLGHRQWQYGIIAGVNADVPLDYEQLIRLDEQLIRDKNRADKEQITALPVVKATAEDKDLRCCICMCDVEQDEELRVLPCTHKYHRTCIDEWLTYNGCCPVDKKRIGPQKSRRRYPQRQGAGRSA